ncbi:hypothetical protein HFV04_021975 [Pseudomonas sp. BIGb0427]|uniref:hypothetical protein n=1 Tax=unclassified Pseudomonas TaxID=196821 RepID=UPI0018A71363|nr:MULTISPECIES: hypothetical protein [unclassified Pseudomonas]QPG62170.1 hypothetical protein HFV04_021975 [Pseudomonas sp. BIGb0427]QVM99080.1 hypothetical protein JYG36_13260 [Pseudomonas sp. SORT22]UVM64507.1 hypothetical protein LOY34_14210 [Pseudomonas sp. B21-009]
MAGPPWRRSIVSLLSPDRFIAVLGAQGVGLCQRQGQQQRWLSSLDFIAERSLAWAVALESLQHLLVEHAGKGAQLQVLLSAQYSRFCLVPWSAAISRPDELQQYARACFEAHYGQSLEGWRIVVSPEAGGCPRIASATPQALLDQLEALCRNLGLRLRSTRPYLMAAYNHFAEQLGQGDFLFVLAEPQRSVCLLAQNGAWQHVSAQGCSDSDQALQALIARHSELHQGEGQLPVYLHAPGRLEPVPALAGVQLCELAPAPLAVRDVLCSMSRAVA